MMWGITVAKHKLLLKRIILIFIIVALIIIFCHPGNFAASDYSCIKQEDISEYLEPNPDVLKYVSESNTPLCSLPDDKSNAMLYPNTSISDAFLDKLPKSLQIEEGGYWKPKHCIPLFQIVIIVPFRERRDQLNIFLAFVHPFLQQQMIEYRIIVVEQVPNTLFNRAKLFNVGFKEALKLSPFHCVIFHDVDLLPQKLSNIYACTRNPRHMSSSLNTFRYVLPYKSLFGGAIAITKEQFELVNGFSNMFFGWGGEDDDFQNRITSRGLPICRFEPSVARYMMLSHRKETPSENRFINLESGIDRFATDGLNNLQYVIVNSMQEKLYTWVLVDV